MKGTSADRRTAKAIGRACREAREKLNLTPSQVAKAIAISETFYNKIERGTALPSVPTFAALVKTLGVSADEMLGRADGPLASPEDSPELAALIPMLLRAPSSTLRLVSLLLRAADAKAKESKKQT